MNIDISPLGRAIDRLREAMEVYGQDTTQSIIRDGLVQRFEFTYEICHKLLRRYLSENPGPPERINSMNFADMIRISNENALLLGDWPKWKMYRDMRARTSHSYNEAVALDVVDGIPAFLEEACYLRDRLHERLSG